MKRDPRLWFPLAFLAAASLLTAAALLLQKPAPTWRTSGAGCPPPTTMSPAFAGVEERD